MEFVCWMEEFQINYIEIVYFYYNVLDDEVVWSFMVEVYLFIIIVGFMVIYVFIIIVGRCINCVYDC